MPENNTENTCSRCKLVALLEENVKELGVLIQEQLGTQSWKPYLNMNARTLGNKQEELDILVQEGKYELIGISETW